MSKRKKPPVTKTALPEPTDTTADTGTGKRERHGVNVNVWFDGPVGDAFARLLEEFRPKAGKKAHLEEALKDYLIKLGYLSSDEAGCD